jgi:hypothetical protein
MICRDLVADHRVERRRFLAVALIVTNARCANGNRWKAFGGHAQRASCPRLPADPVSPPSVQRCPFVSTSVHVCPNRSGARAAQKPRNIEQLRLRTRPNS